MADERPGQASVQYNDVRGESAADVSDDLGTLQEAAKKLGFTGSGRVVGIGIYGGDEGPASMHGLVSVAFQVVDDCPGADGLNAALGQSGGVLEVTEYHVDGVPVADFVACFKRIQVCVFSGHINATTVRVLDHIDL